MAKPSLAAVMAEKPSVDGDDGEAPDGASDEEKDGAKMDAAHHLISAVKSGDAEGVLKCFGILSDLHGSGDGKEDDGDGEGEEEATHY